MKKPRGRPRTPIFYEIVELLQRRPQLSGYQIATIVGVSPRRVHAVSTVSGEKIIRRKDRAAQRAHILQEAANRDELQITLNAV